MLSFALLPDRRFVEVRSCLGCKVLSVHQNGHPWPDFGQQPLRIKSSSPVGASALATRTQRLELASNCSIWMYSHTSVTISANAPYHSMYFGTPCSAARSIRSK